MTDPLVAGPTRGSRSDTDKALKHVHTSCVLPAEGRAQEQETLFAPIATSWPPLVPLGRPTQVSQAPEEGADGQAEEAQTGTSRQRTGPPRGVVGALRRSTRYPEQTSGDPDASAGLRPLSSLRALRRIESRSDSVVNAMTVAPRGVPDVLRRHTSPLRRLTITDEETGEELRPLTIQDLLDGMPPKVKRRLARLPAATLQQLAALPTDAQQALLLLPEDTQLALIDALEGGLPQPEGPGPKAPGAMVPVGGGTNGHDVEPGHNPPGLPPDLVDFLLGRSPDPDWLKGAAVTIHLPQAPAPMLALPGPDPSLGPLRPPPHQPTKSPQERREAYGEELLTSRPQPVPSDNPVAASQQVSDVAANHGKRIAEREEARQDSEWSKAPVAAYGANARQEADVEHQGKVTVAEKAVAAFPNYERAKRANKKLPALKTAEAEHQRLTSAPPDLDAVQSDAEAEWQADLTSMRKAGLARNVIDNLVVAIPAQELHGYLAASGAVPIARLASRLSPPQVSGLLTACDGKIPATLTDTVADALPALFAAGANASLIVTGIKRLGVQTATLMAAPPAACVQLLKVTNLPRLLVMVQGGETAHLSALVPLIPLPAMVTLLDCAATAADLGLLFAAGPAALASMLTAGVSTPALTLWCRGPVLASTVLLLGRPDLPACLPILPALGSDNVGPVQLMATLVAGAPAGVVASAVAYAPKLRQRAGQTLTYFQGHPGDTQQDYQDATAQLAATAASRAPTPNGMGTALSGAQFQKWNHTATVDDPTLMMMIQEGYAQIVYNDTFETTTEQVNGGDTEEYFVRTWDGANWVRRWVVHIHRKKGDNKQQAPSASHIKRYEERKLKDASRIAVATALAAYCRTFHP